MHSLFILFSQVSVDEGLEGAMDRQPVWNSCKFSILELKQVFFFPNSCKFLILHTASLVTGLVISKFLSRYPVGNLKELQSVPTIPLPVPIFFLNHSQLISTHVSWFFFSLIVTDRSSLFYYSQFLAHSLLGTRVFFCLYYSQLGSPEVPGR